MTNPSAVPVIRLAEVDSTNAEAMRRARSGERGPLWIMSSQQTAGKGRSGRTWTSDAGNLFASYLFTLDRGRSQAYQLSLVAGVAAYDAVRPLLDDRAAAVLRLKWPNDLLIGTAKLGGILVESTTHPAAAGLAAVIGIGLNLASHPDGLGRAATHLSGLGVTLSPPEMRDKLGLSLARWLEIWNEGQEFDRVRTAWIERAGPEGEELSVNAGSGPVLGRYAGLAPDGALLLVDLDGSLRRISYGDVTLRE